MSGFLGGGGGGAAIGSIVIGGTDKSVLFIDVAGKLAQDNVNFNYDSSTKTLQLGSTSGTAGKLEFAFPAGGSPAGTVTLSGPLDGLTASYSLQLPPNLPATQQALINGGGGDTRLFWSPFAAPSGHLEVQITTLDGTGLSTASSLSGGTLAWLTDTNFLDVFAGVLFEDYLFTNRPTSPVKGMVSTFRDSDTDVWGAVITNSGAANKTVLGFFNGTNWTVIGK